MWDGDGSGGGDPAEGPLGGPGRSANTGTGVGTSNANTGVSGTARGPANRGAGGNTPANPAGNPNAAPGYGRSAPQAANPTGYSLEQARKQGRSGAYPERSFGQAIGNFATDVFSGGFLDYSPDPARASAPMDFTPARGMVNALDPTGLAGLGMMAFDFSPDTAIGSRTTLGVDGFDGAQTDIAAGDNRGGGLQQALSRNSSPVQQQPDRRELARALQAGTSSLALQPGYTRAGRGVVNI